MGGDMIERIIEVAMKIFIADDEKKVRNAMRLLIEGEDSYTICAEAANSQELFSYLNFCKPDLLLLDKELPGIKLSAQTLQSIRSVVPQMKIVVMGVDISGKALLLNADALISKCSSPQSVLSTLQKLAPEPMPGRLTGLYSTLHY
jgi:DNA-binding NarL/FixJ family response regulator